MNTRELDELRILIDEVDDQILSLLARRFALTTEVGYYKAQNNLEPLNTTREAKQYKRLEKLAEKYGLPAGIEKDVFRIIMQYSKQWHTIIKKGW
ncbi:MAG: chorismate mutase [Candidatus Ancillula sp.]|jgi:chorismate mutase|nr:chorismate mutase [Candidatus Ancillula sp.]